MSQIRIRELRLRNYRAFSDVRLVLDDVTFLVGRNGAGKSTLLDAFSFISEALTDSLGTALERRGNLEGVRRRQPGRGRKSDVWVAIVFDFENQPMLYGFKIGSDSRNSSYVVKSEELSPLSQGFVRDKQDVLSHYYTPSLAPDAETLTFPLVAGLGPRWKAVFEAIKGVSVHQFSPRAIQAEPSIGGEERLSRDGGNAGDVLKRVKSKDRTWIVDALQAAVPGVRDVRATARAGRRVIVFEQESEGGGANEFDASMMSEGTVRSLGILLALRQSPRPSIVLIDEIEDSLHPFAQSVMLDSIEATSEEFPVIVSTHSPEVLSHAAARGERIRIVQWHEGASVVQHLGKKTLENLRPPIDVGELLRSNALWTDGAPATNGPGDDFFKVD